MPWPESVTGKLREQIQVIRAFWDCWQNGTKLKFRGEYYKISLMSPFFHAGAIEHPNIPIYIAGVNKGLAKLAGEICDGFHVHPFHSVRYLKEVMIPAIEEGAAKERRQREDIAVSVTAFVATTPEEMNFARAQIRILCLHALLSLRHEFAWLERCSGEALRSRGARRMD